MATTTNSSSSSSPSSTQLVNRVEYALSPLLQLSALLLMSLPLYGQFFRRKMLALKDGLANSLIAYQFAQICFLLPAIVYNFYMISAWLFLDAHFDVYKLFWFGLLVPAATALISNATFFLTLDRCLILIWPISYPKRRPQRLVTRIGALLGISIFVANIAETIFLELPLDVEKAAYCLNHPCVATKYHYKYQVITNNVQCVCNLAIGLLFFNLLRHKAAEQGQQNSNGGKISRIRNRIVIMTVAFEIFFKILPGFGCTLVNNVCEGINLSNQFTPSISYSVNILFTSILISDYLGWYIMLFTSIDTFAVSLYYALVLLKRPKALCLGLIGENSSKSSTNHHQQPKHQLITIVRLSLANTSSPHHPHSPN